MFVYPKYQLLTHHIWRCCWVSPGLFLWFCTRAWAQG